MDIRTFKRTGSVMLSLLLATVFVVPVMLAVFNIPAQAAIDPYCSEYYKVKSGDKLREIAEKYNVTLNRLARANDVQKTYRPVAGEQLCIPSLATFTSSTKWTATYDGTKITLDGSGFKKNYPMVLRARQNDTQRLITLARGISSDKSGELSKSFKVPKDLVDKPSIIVCLKDGVTDGLTCKLIWRR